MVIAITEEAKRILSKFIERDIKQNNKLPILNYKAENNGNTITSIYSSEYLKRIIGFFECFSFNLKISINKDYPLITKRIISSPQNLFKPTYPPRYHNLEFS